MRVEWTTSAGDDIERIINFYIAHDGLTEALGQLDEIEHQTDRLAEYPELGWPGRVKGTRELVLNGTPVVITYRIQGEIVQILRLVPQRRK